MNKHIQKLIREQFNIGNMDFNNKPKKHANIFNKNFIHPYYYKVLDGTITKSEIKELNQLVGIVKPKDKQELNKIVKLYSKNYPYESLNWLDVHDITDMSYMFNGYAGLYNEIISNEYNGDISKWDVSNVKTMEGMFAFSLFNGDISDWDVSNVTNMSEIFGGNDELGTAFNGDISKWNVSNVKNMSRMFYSSIFNTDISRWNVSSVEDMSFMFTNASFNHDISNWDVSHVTDMSYMFQYSAFNGNISGWNVSLVTDMNGMFWYSAFNGNISRWDVSNVKSMDHMFAETDFNQDISGWDVRKVILYNNIFKGNKKMKEGYKPKKFKRYI